MAEARNMEGHTKAGVFFHDDCLRYAEIVTSDRDVVLRRLGSCNFEFDVLRAIDDQDSEALETLREALGDVFAGSAPDEVCVAIEPSHCYFFKTRVPSDASDEALRSQILGEVAMVADNEAALHIASEELGVSFDDDGVEMLDLQVMAVPEAFSQSLESILSEVSGEKHYLPSIHGAGSLLVRSVGQRESNGSSSDRAIDIAVGSFGARTEYAVCENGKLVHMQFAPSVTVDDSLYFCGSILKRLGVGPNDLSSVSIYGDSQLEESAEKFERIFRSNTSILDPLDIISLEGQERGTFDASSFVACVGVAIDLID